MKKRITIAILSAFSFSLSAFAGLSVSNLVTYASTGGASTNTGTPVLIGTAYLANAPSFIISDGGTATTNALTGYVLYGIGTNTANMTSVATYTKAATNAADGTITPAGISFQIYATVQLVTTNSVSAGAKAAFSTQ